MNSRNSLFRFKITRVLPTFRRSAQRPLQLLSTSTNLDLSGNATLLRIVFEIAEGDAEVVTVSPSFFAGHVFRRTASQTPSVIDSDAARVMAFFFHFRKHFFAVFFESNRSPPSLSPSAAGSSVASKVPRSLQELDPKLC